VTTRQLILTVDVGTSALKTVVYDRAGRVMASSTQRYSYRMPRRAEPRPILKLKATPSSTARMK
jgi:sugar (pentulose or hexulose) kinase